jgi:hypothetical protein
MQRTKAMAGFDTYKDAFPHAKLTRSREGVLEVVLHTNGGTLIFNGYTHEEFVELFHQINQDAGNRVVILTGAGEAFIDRIDPEGFDFFSPRGYDKIYREGKKGPCKSARHSGAGDRRAQRSDDGPLRICTSCRRRRRALPGSLSKEIMARHVPASPPAEIGATAREAEQHSTSRFPAEALESVRA